MYFRRKSSGGRAYLQIVESRREGDQVRQQVITTLGRYDDPKASGQLERLLRPMRLVVGSGWPPTPQQRPRTHRAEPT